MDANAIWKLCARKHYSAGYAEYWMAHICCEACRYTSTSGPHHIRSRGAGGDDNPDNLLSLCPEDHRVFHQLGRSVFCRRYPHLKAKVDAALARARA